MSLNWNISKTEGYKIIEAARERGDEEAEKKEFTTAEALIWITMAVDLGEITEANKAEFLARAKISEGLNGAMRYKAENGKSIPVYVTAEEVNRYVGLSTNVADLPKTKWLKRLYDGKIKDAEWRFKKLKETEVK